MNRITRGDLLREVLSEHGILDDLSKFVAKTLEVLRRHTSNDIVDLDLNKMKSFKSEVKQRWLKCTRNKEKFFHRFESWLNVEFDLVELTNPSKRKDVPSCSRASDFNIMQSDITKRRKTAKLRGAHSADELAYAAQMKLREEGRLIQAKLVKEINFTSPNRPAKIKKKITELSPTPLTDHEALALIINTGMSKRSYMYLKNAHKAHHSKILPKYRNITAVREECYPPNITVTEMCMSVKLQSLCDHTATQLVALQDSLIQSKLTNGEILHCTVLYKYGADGSGSHAKYSLPINEELTENNDEEHIFATFLCPVQVWIEVNDGGSKELLWQNPVPSSPIYCRPVRLEFVKENDEVIKTEFDRMAAEISDINPTILESICVYHEFIPTMVDGKVVQTLSDSSSSSSCYLCLPETTPKGMNDYRSIYGKQTSTEMLKYGISPLHLYLNSLDCILHLGYRMEIKNWQARGKENKARVKKRKKEIQKFLKEKLAVNVDMPTQGKGNTNTGKSELYKNLYAYSVI